MEENGGSDGSGDSISLTESDEAGGSEDEGGVGCGGVVEFAESRLEIPSLRRDEE